MGNVHLVKYYRYLRFFEDGSVISGIFQTRQKREVLEEMLSGKTLDMAVEKDETWRETMVGEYICKREQVTVKVAKAGSIFTYDLKLCPGEGRPHDLLIMLYQLKVIDTN